MHRCTILPDDRPHVDISHNNRGHYEGEDEGEGEDEVSQPLTSIGGQGLGCCVGLFAAHLWEHLLQRWGWGMCLGLELGTPAGVPLSCRGTAAAASLAAAAGVQKRHNGKYHQSQQHPHDQDHHHHHHHDTGNSAVLPRCCRQPPVPEAKYSPLTIAASIAATPIFASSIAVTVTALSHAIG